MRFLHGGAYNSDIRRLRDRIRGNGTRANIQAIPVSHPFSPGAQLDVYINMAYQPNDQMPNINGSLYVVAFGNAHGIWHFNGLGVLGAPLPGVPMIGGQAGDYAALGFPHNGPNISNVNLGGAVAAMSAFTNAGMNATVTTNMAILVISVIEATRLSPIEVGITSVLGKVTTYIPDWVAIHNWGGHRLG